jgi:hypothetical protein
MVILLEWSVLVCGYQAVFELGEFFDSECLDEVYNNEEDAIKGDSVPFFVIGVFLVYANKLMNCNKFIDICIFVER